jgi:hypothetical protein
MARRVGLAVPVEAESAAEQPERLPVPIAAMIIVLLSAGLWAGIFWAVRALLA